MQPVLYYIVVPTVAVLLTVIIRRFKQGRSLVRCVRGPPSPSFLLGHEYLLRNREHAGDLETEWRQQYGAVYRTKGCFSEDILSVSDPKALQYIFHVSGYRFPKTRDANRSINAFTGPGLVVVEGDIHQRQRRILGPAFTVSQLRLFLTIFQASAAKLTDKINERVVDGEVLNMLEWTSKAALDIIGIAAFRYHFNSLSGRETELMKSLNNLFTEAAMSPTSFELLYSALWRILPEWLLLALEWLPTRETKRMNWFRDVAMKVSRPIFDRQLKEVANDVNPAEKDVKKMSDIEIDSQLATFVIAGHDTTATTMAWLLYELSLHPEDQAKIREEIAQTKLNAQGALSSNDYDSMVWLNACIKEVLRLHPLIYSLFRKSVQDDVLPLAEPITTSDGKVCSEIPISKGQTVMASVYTYNRLPSVWGEDAEEWNPGRFLDNRDIKQTSLGAYANLCDFHLLIFSGISLSCSVMELQSVVTELLNNFEFRMPKGVSKLQHGPALDGLLPLVPGKADEGPQVPLAVTCLHK
ncbi:cytochrome P450 [Armillaria mellea]|nr:cytochrome P450 [Armillaria mellea]